MKKTIIAHFFTTININMVLRMLIFILNPYNWIRLQDGKWIKKTEEKLLDYLGLKNSKIISFYNARSALFHSLDMIGVNREDEVIIQAYTCVSVVNSVLQTGAKIVYTDIDETLNIDINDLKNKITPKTKAIIIQHTFGNPADIENIKKICGEKNIILIEDCAHSLGAEFEGKKVGIFGDFSIFSFGRDKVISTVNGGFLVINNPIYFDKIDEIKSKLTHKSNKIILKNIIYIFASYKAKIFYDFFSLGKIIMLVSIKLHIIPEVLESSEKSCLNKDFYSLYPNSLAYLGFYELDKVDFYNEKRIKNALTIKNYLKNDKYPKTLDNSKNIYLRFVYFSKERDKIKKLAKQNKILLGDWYDSVIAPLKDVETNTSYTLGTCMNAEKYAKKTLNIPNYIEISKKDIKKVLDLLKNN